MKHSTRNLHQTDVPFQQPTSLKLRKGCDFYEQEMLKYPYRAAFHSYAEYLYSFLLEGDPLVTRYVPQPFKWRFGKHIYIPDSYYVRNGLEVVIEIKPRGDMKDSLKQRVQTHCQQSGREFKVISNEHILDREPEALLWQNIVQVLLSFQDSVTEIEELDLLERIEANGTLSLGDVVHLATRDRSQLHEVGLFRLCHRGQVDFAPKNAPLQMNTEFVLRT